MNTSITPSPLSFREQKLASAAVAFAPEGFLLSKIASETIDVKACTQEQRTCLLGGSKISIAARGNLIIRKAVPKRAFIASSTSANDFFRENPLATQFVIQGSFDLRSVKLVLDASTTADGIGMEECAPLPMGNNFTQGVLLYQAANALGIEGIARSIRYHLSKQISDSNQPLSYEELNTVIGRVPVTDSLLHHVANDFCYRRFKKSIPDIKKFEQWLSKADQNGLRRKMMQIDAEHKAKRTAYLA